MESKFQAGVGYFMSRAGKGGCLHVLSCYAPTFAAAREEMAKFFSTVQQALTFIPSQNASFNACVGSSMEDGEWWDEKGLHDRGDLNDAGRELIFFLSCKCKATACNTWFIKVITSIGSTHGPSSVIYMYYHEEDQPC